MSVDLGAVQVEPLQVGQLHQVHARCALNIAATQVQFCKKNEHCRDRYAHMRMNPCMHGHIQRQTYSGTLVSISVFKTWWQLKGIWWRPQHQRNWQAQRPPSTLWLHLLQQTFYFLTYLHNCEFSSTCRHKSLIEHRFSLSVYKFKKIKIQSVLYKFIVYYAFVMTVLYASTAKHYITVTHACPDITVIVDWV